MKRSIFYIALSLIMTSCGFDLGNKKNIKISGTWRLADIEVLNVKGQDEDAYAKEAFYREIVSTGVLTSFFEDGSFSEVTGKGAYKTGSWQFLKEEGALIITDSGRKSDPIFIKPEVNPNGQEFMILPMITNGVTLRLVKESQPMKDFLDDPYHFTNNTWRVKPKQAETTVQLNKRLANYIKHLALILKAVKDRKQDVVSFEFSLGPVRIYNAAIGIHPFEQVPGYWKNCFYDDTDAAKAYYLYEQYLEVDSYKGGSTGDWIQDDYNILLSIHDGFIKSVETTK
ncbi:MAG TPA: hypothetical protein VGD33_07155 [Chitinophagaceae bacterium]